MREIILKIHDLSMLKDGRKSLRDRIWIHLITELINWLFLKNSDGQIGLDRKTKSSS